MQADGAWDPEQGPDPRCWQRGALTDVLHVRDDQDEDEDEEGAKGNGEGEGEGEGGGGAGGGAGWGVSAEALAALCDEAETPPPLLELQVLLSSTRAHFHTPGPPARPRAPRPAGPRGIPPRRDCRRRSRAP